MGDLVKTFNPGDLPRPQPEGSSVEAGRGDGYAQFNRAMDRRHLGFLQEQAYKSRYHTDQSMTIWIGNDPGAERHISIRLLDALEHDPKFGSAAAVAMSEFMTSQSFYELFMPAARSIVADHTGDGRTAGVAMLDKMLELRGSRMSAAGRSNTRHYLAELRQATGAPPGKFDFLR